MTIADILRRNGGPGLFISDGTPWQESVSRGSQITNISNLSDTWGKTQPFTAGNIRVGGAQVWASQFYNLLSEVTYSGIPLMPAVGGGGISNNPRVVTQTEGMAETAVDVAYSFGVNAINVKRILTKLRFDGEVIYDAQTSAKPKFAFTIYYGSEQIQDPAIKAVIEERTPYYPQQIYIVLQQVTRYGAAHLPTNVDAEFRTEVVSDDKAIVIYPDNEIKVPSGLVFPDYDRRYFYVFVKEGKWGTFRKYDLDTYEFISSAAVSITPNKDSLGNTLEAMFDGNGAAWFPEARLTVAQQESSEGRARVYVVDPETGAQLAVNGLNEQSFQPNDTFDRGGMMPWWEDGVKVVSMGPNGGSFVAFESGGFRGYYGLYTVSGSAFGGGVIVSRAARDMTSINISNLLNSQGGKNGCFLTFGDNKDKIAKIDANGITVIASLSEPPLPHNVMLLGGKIVMTQQNHGYRVLSLDGTLEKTVLNDSFPGFIVRGGSVGDSGQWRERANLTDMTLGFATRLDGNAVVYFDFDKDTYEKFPYTTDDGSALYTQLWDSDKQQAIALRSSVKSAIVQLPVKVFGGTILLRDFIRSLYVGTGRYRAQDISFENIDDTIYGAGIFSVTKLSDIVNNICSLYRIEKLEGERTVRFFRNRLNNGLNAVTLTISTDELALLSEGAPGVVLSSKELTTGSKTAEIELEFLDADNEYVPNKVSWRRPDALATETGKLSLSVPIVMDKNIAQVLIQNVFADNEAADVEHRFRLPPSHNFYGKGDLVRILHNEFVIVCQIREETLNRDFSLSCIADGIILQTGAVVSIPDTPTGTPGAGGLDSATLSNIFDIPALLPEQNPVNSTYFVQYAALYGDKPEWSAGYLARKIEGGEYASLFAVGSAKDVIAYKTTAALTDKRWVTDNDLLPLAPLFGRWPIERNKTAAQLQTEPSSNLALYGAPGRWEVVRFASIVDGIASGVIRGLRGTEAACGLHATGDLFIPIGANTVSEARAASVIGIAEAYKAASPSANFTAAPERLHTPVGASLRPWAPFGLSASRSGLSGDVAVSWHRRDRKGSGWGGTSPLSETSEAYDAELLRSNGSVLRTFAGLTQPLLTYTAVQQAEDQTSSLTEFTLIIYQVSSVVGRGFGNKETVDVGPV